ncbi:flagellar basal body rod protein FlgB [Algiphilus aromaticivorans]|jgi:flagellar basal-body rod protein FlgB|uniref:flagellar basal body rod protein FlgB n=1 Tax=Algiphilus aromaticivorans TaxID=382454 RepID=UPI0005C1597B|nr:flagellar basal body protein [Algiphilus aromaticivorans]
MAHPLFGIHANALSLQSQRLEMIAGNLANADTPGYRARDIDFKAALEAAAAGQQRPAETVYRTVDAALDGNSVDASKEQAAFADAALRYEAALRFIDGRASSMMTAITGQ